MSADQEAETIATYDRTAASWATEHEIVNDWLGTAAEFKQLLPSGRVLEVGCGGGRDAAELLRLGYDYLGTDASAKMVQVVQERLPSAHFEQMSVYDVAKLEQQFDGLWACAVLLHIPKRRIDEAIRPLNRVLRLGAIGMISMKDGNAEEFEVRDKGGTHEERLFVYWSKADFTNVIERNGFRLVNYTYRPSDARTNWHAFFVQKDQEV